MYFWQMSNVLNRLHELEISARKVALIVEHLKVENARLKKENARLMTGNTVTNDKLGVVEMGDKADKNNQWKQEIKAEIDRSLDDR